MIIDLKLNVGHYDLISWPSVFALCLIDLSTFWYDMILDLNEMLVTMP